MIEWLLSAYVEDQVKKMHHVSYCDSEADASYGNLVAAIALGFGAYLLLF